MNNHNNNNISHHPRPSDVITGGDVDEDITDTDSPPSQSHHEDEHEPPSSPSASLSPAARLQSHSDDDDSETERDEVERGEAVEEQQQRQEHMITQRTQKTNTPATTQRQQPLQQQQQHHRPVVYSTNPQDYTHNPDDWRAMAAFQRRSQAEIEADDEAEDDDDDDDDDEDDEHRRGEELQADDDEEEEEENEEEKKHPPPSSRQHPSHHRAHNNNNEHRNNSNTTNNNNGRVPQQIAGGGGGGIRNYPPRVDSNRGAINQFGDDEEEEDEDVDINRTFRMQNNNKKNNTNTVMTNNENIDMTNINNNNNTNVNTNTGRVRGVRLNDPNQHLYGAPIAPATTLPPRPVNNNTNAAPNSGATTPSSATSGLNTPNSNDNSNTSQPCYVWSIDHYPQFKANSRDRQFSPEFQLDGLTWRLLFFPNGNVAPIHQHIDSYQPAALYLQLVSPSTLPATYGHTFRFTLIPPSHIPLQPKTQESMYRFINEEGLNDRGFQQFATQHELNMYLHPPKHTLHIKVEVQRTLINTPSIHSTWNMLDMNYDSKAITGFVGLKNQGATCYMNSMLQTLFHLPVFRQYIYAMPTADKTTLSPPNNALTTTTNNTSPSPFALPLSLQRCFFQLQTANQAPSTKQLTQAFGWNSLEAFMQHDVQEFCRVLLDNLSERMKGTIMEGKIEALFAGKQQMFIECIHVPYKSERIEAFLDLAMNVKGCASLTQSFEQYIEVEILDKENKYRAEQYGLQEARKGCRFLSFPPVLQLQLKRFEYNFERDMNVKVNDRFEFPISIDLSAYSIPPSTIEEQQEYEKDPPIYHLHSVLVHSGSGHGGHYYCYIRPFMSNLPYIASPWYKFDDEMVTKATEADATIGNFGGELKGMNGNYFGIQRVSIANAYMLVYIRQSMTLQPLDKEVMKLQGIEMPEENKDNTQQDTITNNTNATTTSMEIQKDGENEQKIHASIDEHKDHPSVPVIKEEKEQQMQIDAQTEALTRDGTIEPTAAGENASNPDVLFKDIAYKKDNNNDRAALPGVPPMTTGEDEKMHTTTTNDGREVDEENALNTNTNTNNNQTDLDAVDIPPTPLLVPLPPALLTRFQLEEEKLKREKDERQRAHLYTEIKLLSEITLQSLSQYTGMGVELTVAQHDDTAENTDEISFNTPFVTLKVLKQHSIGEARMIVPNNTTTTINPPSITNINTNINTNANTTNTNTDTTTNNNTAAKTPESEWVTATHIPLDRQQYWRFTPRQNDTVRPSRYVSVTNQAPIEMSTTSTLNKSDSKRYFVRDTLYDQHLSLLPYQTHLSKEFTELQIAGERETNDRVLFLIKWYHVERQQLEYLGSIIVNKNWTFGQVTQYIVTWMKAQKKWQTKEQILASIEDKKMMDVDTANNTPITNTNHTTTEMSDDQHQQHTADAADIQVEVDAVDAAQLMLWEEETVDADKLPQLLPDMTLINTKSMHGDILCLQYRWSEQELELLKQSYQRHTKEIATTVTTTVVNTNNDTPATESNNTQPADTTTDNKTSDEEAGKRRRVDLYQTTTSTISNRTLFPNEFHIDAPSYLRFLHNRVTVEFRQKPYVPATKDRPSPKNRIYRLELSKQMPYTAAVERLGQLLGIDPGRIAVFKPSYTLSLPDHISVDRQPIMMGNRLLGLLDHRAPILYFDIAEFSPAQLRENFVIPITYIYQDLDEVIFKVLVPKNALFYQLQDIVRAKVTQINETTKRQKTSTTAPQATTQQGSTVVTTISTTTMMTEEQDSAAVPPAVTAHDGNVSPSAALAAASNFPASSSSVPPLCFFMCLMDRNVTVFPPWTRIQDCLERSRYKAVELICQEMDEAWQRYINKDRQLLRERKLTLRTQRQLLLAEQQQQQGSQPADQTSSNNNDDQQQHGEDVKTSDTNTNNRKSNNNAVRKTYSGIYGSDESASDEEQDNNNDELDPESISPPPEQDPEQPDIELKIYRIVPNLRIPSHIYHQTYHHPFIITVPKSTTLSQVLSLIQEKQHITSPLRKEKMKLTIVCSHSIRELDIPMPDDMSPSGNQRDIDDTDITRSIDDSNITTSPRNYNYRDSMMNQAIGAVYKYYELQTSVLGFGLLDIDHYRAHEKQQHMNNPMMSINSSIYNPNTGITMNTNINTNNTTTTQISGNNSTTTNVPYTLMNNNNTTTNNNTPTQGGGPAPVGPLNQSNPPGAWYNVNNTNTTNIVNNNNTNNTIGGGGGVGVGPGWNNTRLNNNQAIRFYQSSQQQ